MGINYEHAFYVKFIRCNIICMYRTKATVTLKRVSAGFYASPGHPALRLSDDSAVSKTLSAFLDRFLGNVGGVSDPAARIRSISTLQWRWGIALWCNQEEPTACIADSIEEALLLTLQTTRSRAVNLAVTGS